MRAIGFFEPLPIDDPKSLTDLDLPRPVPSGKDLLVEVKAVAVNPVDTKVRQSRTSQNGVPVVLGYDAAGIVAEAGPDVTSYKVGDEVYYAGDITRDGTNSEYHLIDERIVGRKPTSLSFAEAAAMPLTAITAWEALFDRLKVNDPVPAGSNALLIIGGSGGVGSIAVQLARQLTNMTIIATASRPESRSWVSELRCASCSRSFKTDGASDRSSGTGSPRLCFFDNAHRATRERYCRIDRATGPFSAHRRSR